MDRQEERRAHLALANRVRELEAQLASARQPQAHEAISPSSHGGGPSSPAHAIAQPLHANGGGLNSDGAAESTADAIATGLFDDQPGNTDIGYFGASSNHAFFWSLTSSLDELSRKQPGRQNLPPRQVGASEGPRRLPLPPLKMVTAEQQPRPQQDSFPGRKTAIGWVNIFFDTVAPALPFVDKLMLVREIDLVDSRTGTWQSCPSNTQALMSIVFAHALAISEDGTAEPFYRRALDLLDEKGLCLPTTEALQALLLLASFQQNSQRAQESITTHFRAVKAAYQLGVHSPSSYGRFGSKDKELRSVLWFAVVNEDRLIGSGLGRPFLVPAQHIQTKLKDLMSNGHQRPGDHFAFGRSSLHYFLHSTKLHEIIGSVVDAMHNSNITSTHDLTLSELVPRVMESLRQLENLGKDASRYTLVSNQTADTWLATDLDEQRYTILSSLHRYRVDMLVNAPLLLAVLRHVSTTDDPSDSDLYVQVAVSILQAYLQKINDFHNLLCSILRIQPSFLRRNAVWWLCNYMRMTSPEIENLMRRALDTLRLVGGTSIMSRKAHRCLQRYLDSFTRDGEVQSQISLDASVVSHSETTRPWPYGLTPEDMSAAGGMVWNSSVDELMTGMRAEDFLGEDVFAMSFNISDFDATGFI
ncbi:uncharacterized protein MAM_01167 [Metarhizium album ARSEF 1941]|uniref:Transcription factor, fungi n=1 Tax=Metarhizium album (strain ARSEF 1941) TaxID=1081103 RepID=A0A0B2X2A8_METAS|nr:uncharacterized protein MAM_01167 [Metarhizium album ARSEF 1941]KHO00389.1 Transcription factor, fungi [Metarhizium album ARSEF 1941]